MDAHDRSAVKFSRAIASNRYYICWLAVSFQEIKFCDPDAHPPPLVDTRVLWFTALIASSNLFISTVIETVMENFCTWSNVERHFSKCVHCIGEYDHDKHWLTIVWNARFFFIGNILYWKLTVETDRRRLAFISLPRSVIRVWILNAILPVGISLRSNGGISWHLLANGSQWSALARVNPVLTILRKTIDITLDQHSLI